MSGKVDAKIELIRVQITHEIERVQNLAASDTVRGMLNGLRKAVQIIDSTDERVR